jgi:hypothetical protein
MVDDLIFSIEKNYQTKSLPERPNEKAVRTLITNREELYE